MADSSSGPIRETAAVKETDFSLRNVVDNGSDFRENRVADEGNVYGGELRLRYNRGLDPEGFRLGTELFDDGWFGNPTWATPERAEKFTSFVADGVLELLDGVMKARDIRRQQHEGK